MTSTTHQPYRVLARKYRPATFEQMIGQDALVQTLTNAIALGGWRMPSFLLACAALAKHQQPVSCKRSEL